MSTIRTAIELQDNFTGVLNSIVSAVNLGLSAMNDLNSSMNNPIDTASFDGAREAANQAAIAIQEMKEAMQNVDAPATGTPAAPRNSVPVHVPVVPDVPDPLIDNPAPVPVEWQSDNLEVFTGTGIERFQKEVQSANNMLNTLNTTQERIAATAAQTDLFPESAVSDMSNMGNRLTAIWQRIQAIESNPLNLGTDEANAELEQLRGQLDQAVKEQEALNRAVENMDVEAANQAYLRLSQTVGNTERYIRDNTDEQGRFNRAVEDGTEQANKLMNMIKGAVAVYVSVQTVQKALDLSDQLTSTTARLNLMNDGLQTTQDLQNMIYLSAERSRGSYQQTADAVSKLGLMAGDAFSSSEEIIAFMEQLNKQFTIAGTEAAGIDAAMLQLTQAMGSGVLRGEEYNSVLEQAPNIIQAIADYLDVPKGQLKDMAAEGQITAEIVKNAMFAAADETNAKFESMPKTFSQIWTSFQNNALIAFQPVLNRLNKLANSEAFQTSVNNVINGFAMMAGVVIKIFDLMVSVAGVVADNWSWLAPIIGGVTVALIAYYTALGIYNTIQLISNGIKSAAALVSQIHSASLEMETGTTFMATAAQYGFNTALLACPITWIVAMIIALIAVLILLWDNCEGFRNFIVDNYARQAKALSEFYNGVVVPVVNGIISGQDTVVNAVKDGCISIINFISDMAISAVDNIQWLADAMQNMIDVYNSIAGVFGAAQIDADFVLNEQSINAMRDKAISDIESTFNGMKSSPLSEIDLDKVYALIDEYADKARNFKVSDFVNGLISELFDTNIPGEDEYSNLADYGSGIAETSAATADNTRNMAENLSLTDDDLKWLRDMAERESINTFTTAEVKVEMVNNNNLSSEMDIDGFINIFKDEVEEAMISMAEGVHA